MARTALAHRATAPAAPRRSTEGRSSGSATAPRPRLTVVTRPNPSSSSVPFTLLCTAVIAVTLFAVLMLNISMSDTSFRLAELQKESHRLTVQEQSLAEESERLSTPQELQKRATELGMVPAGTPAYIDLGQGAIIGEPLPAGGLAAPAELAPVPAAQIYDDDTYWGMGNEGR